MVDGELVILDLLDEGNPLGRSSDNGIESDGGGLL